MIFFYLLSFFNPFDRKIWSNQVIPFLKFPTIMLKLMTDPKSSFRVGWLDKRGMVTSNTRGTATCENSESDLTDQSLIMAIQGSCMALFKLF